MRPICISETSVSNHFTPRNNPEEGRIQFNRSGSLRSRILHFVCFYFLFRDVALCGCVVSEFGRCKRYHKISRSVQPISGSRFVLKQYIMNIKEKCVPLSRHVGETDHESTHATFIVIDGALCCLCVLYCCRVDRAQTAHSTQQSL
jgi:hypothetical protein